MQRGITYDHEAVCEILKKQAAIENDAGVKRENLKIAIQCWEDRIMAVVTHADGKSHLWELPKRTTLL